MPEGILLSPVSPLRTVLDVLLLVFERFGKVLENELHTAVQAEK